jgi:hypothetical protein
VTEKRRPPAIQKRTTKAKEEKEPADLIIQQQWKGILIG